MFVGNPCLLGHTVNEIERANDCLAYWDTYYTQSIDFSSIHHKVQVSISISTQTIILHNGHIGNDYSTNYSNQSVGAQ